VVNKGTQIYFTAKGLTYRFDQVDIPEMEEGEESKAMKNSVTHSYTGTWSSLKKFHACSIRMRHGIFHCFGFSPLPFQEYQPGQNDKSVL